MLANKLDSHAHKACDGMQIKIFYTMMPLIQVALNDSWLTSEMNDKQTFQNPE